MSFTNKSNSDGTIDVFVSDKIKVDKEVSSEAVPHVMSEDMRLHRKKLRMRPEMIQRAHELGLITEKDSLYFPEDERKSRIKV